MADAVRIETLENIPEPLHSHFAKVNEDGKDVYEYRPPKQDDGWLSTKAKLERQQKALQDELAVAQSKWTIDDEEVTPDRVKQLIEDQRKREGKEMVSRADAEAEKKELAEKVRAAQKAEIDKRDAANKALQETLERVLIDEGIARAADNPDMPFRLQPGAVGMIIKLVKADKMAKVEGDTVIPMDGNVPMTNKDGNPASLIDLIAAVVAKNQYLALPSQGLGTEPTNGNGGSAPRKKRSEMTRPEKSAFITKYGEEKYLALPM